MIYVNSVFKYVNNDSDEKIRIIDIVNEYVYITNIYGATSMPRKEMIEIIKQEIESNKLILVKDPFAKVIDEKDISKLQRDMREIKWRIIELYWETSKYELLEKKSRTKIFGEISKETGFSNTKVRMIFSRYWQRGMNKNSLLPDYENSGARGRERNLNGVKVGRPKKPNYNGDVIKGISIEKDVKQHILISINKYYRNNNKISLKEAYTLMLRDFYSDVYKEDNIIKHRVWDESRIPTYAQFYYWFKKSHDIKKDIVLRESDKSFNLNNRPLLSNSTFETDGPGTRFQVDATIVDVYLVSSLNRNRVIGRPILYAIIDVFSRLITGVYVGLEGPSWIGAMMALDNMVTNKVEFCACHGIDIDEEQWPCKHIPEIIIADRGEFEGYCVENLINNLNLKIENTSPYRGDLKGIVERNFRTVNEKIKHKTPGSIQKEFRKRGDRDYRLDATLTLEEFTRIYINIVVHHNSKIIDGYNMEKEMIEDEIIPTPIKLWNWGIENKKGRLKTVDRDILRLNILPRGKASISRVGIRINGLYYSSDKAIKEQWFITSKLKSVEVVYDPRNVKKIYIPYNNGLDYEECYLIDSSIQYKDCILEEILFNQELLNELKVNDMRNQNQNNIDLEKEIENIVKKAKKEKKKDIDYNRSSNQKLKGIRNNRIVEKLINKETEAFVIDRGVINKQVDTGVMELDRFKNIESKELTANDKLIQKLRKASEEKFGK